MDLLNNIIWLNQVGMANFNTSGMGGHSFDSSLLVSAFPVGHIYAVPKGDVTWEKYTSFKIKSSLMHNYVSLTPLPIAGHSYCHLPNIAILSFSGTEKPERATGCLSLQVIQRTLWQHTCTLSDREEREKPVTMAKQAPAPTLNEGNGKASDAPPSQLCRDQRMWFDLRATCFSRHNQASLLRAIAHPVTSDARWNAHFTLKLVWCGSSATLADTKINNPTLLSKWNICRIY